MARSLIIPNPRNATIEELTLVSRVGSSETATRCTAIQIKPFQIKPIRGLLFKEQHIERLDQAILDVINNPQKTQRTADFGTLF